MKIRNENVNKFFCTFRQIRFKFVNEKEKQKKINIYVRHWL